MIREVYNQPNVPGPLRMSDDENELQRYYMTCSDYFTELRKKDFCYWFSAYYSALKTRDGFILDIGCGVGQVVNRLADEGLSAVGIDISPIGMRVASMQGRGAFIVASACKLPFKGDSFAAAGFHDFLEHTKTPEICLREMARVLRPHGRIVASAPNFLRVVGLSREYHWHMSGLRQRISNFLNLARKSVISTIFPQALRFEFMQPLLDPNGRGGDTDAVCVTNPIDIRYQLRRLNIRITEQSTASGYPEGIVGRIGRLPIIRSISSSTFIIGIKMTPDEHV